jgi:hypothetical protein
MSDSEFSGGEFRDGFGADDLADFGGGDFGGDFGFGDFPQDNFSQGLVGAGDLTTGMPGQEGGDPYGNVGVQQPQTAGDAIASFYAEEAKNGLTAFAYRLLPGFTKTSTERRTASSSTASTASSAKTPFLRRGLMSAPLQENGDARSHYGAFPQSGASGYNRCSKA